MKAFYIMGQDPMMSEPNIDNIKSALEKAELVVVQDIFMTETAKLADVVFPGTTFAEKRRYIHEFRTKGSKSAKGNRTYREFDAGLEDNL